MNVILVLVTIVVTTLILVLLIGIPVWYAFPLAVLAGVSSALKKSEDSP